MQINIFLKFLLAMVVVGAVNNFAFSQVQGVTPSKINALNHATIGKGSLEIEPNYGFCHSKKKWTVNGESEPLFSMPDSSIAEHMLSLRMAYGISDLLDVGSFIGENFSSLSFRYSTKGDGKLGIAFIGGVNFPVGVTNINTEKSEDETSTYAVGIAASYQLGSSTSIDANFQYQDFFSGSRALPNSQFFTFIDIGHYIKNNTILLIASIGQQVDYSNFDYAQKVTFYPGVAFEQWERLAIALNGSFDIFGNDMDKVNGFSAAFTFVF